MKTPPLLPLNVLVCLLALFLGCACAAEKPLGPPKDMVFEPTDDEEVNIEPSKNPIAKKYQESDAKSMPPKGGILFAGSSSIQKWTTIAVDFKPLQVLGRGVGGSTIADWVKFVPQLVTPYHPKTIVFYAGDNDIGGGKKPEVVAKDFTAFSTDVHKHLPQTKIIFISLKPSIKREKLWPKMVETNTLIQNYAKTTDYITYLDISEAMLTNGKPMPELFTKDMLHMNPTGYAIWTKLLKPKLAGGTVAADTGTKTPGNKSMPDVAPPSGHEPSTRLTSVK